MTRPSDNLNDVESDIGHLRTLITVVTGMAIDLENPSSEQNDISNLLWIARDLVDQIDANIAAAHLAINKKIAHSKGAGA